MKKRFFILLAFVLSVNTIFVFLNGCSNGSGKSSMQCWYYSSASLTAMDNSDSTPHEPDYNGVHAKAFVLVLTLWSTSNPCSYRTHIFPYNTAFATNTTTYVGPSRIYDSMSIVSNNDFDVSHPAGTELKYLFNVNVTSNLSNLHPGTNNLYLLQAPTAPGMHVFTLHLYNYHDTTQNFMVSSLQVKLLP